MSQPVVDSVSILERLIGFPTVSRTPNVELIVYVQTLLEEHGVKTRLVASDDGKNKNLHAHVGPDGKSGVMLSGHTDVVPVTNQNWAVEPFKLTRDGGKFYGRGSADMKGFVACAIRAMVKASKENLKIPLQLALSYDEEIGCVGVRSLLDMLESAHYQPAFCIVGEPTELKIATGHKGKMALKATCIGKEAHSALAPSGMNAIHLASDVISILRREQQWLKKHGARDDDYDIPYSTVHVGRITGGIALNIVPKECVLEFEIRSLAGDDPEEILERIKGEISKVVATAQKHQSEADIIIEVVNTYPGLDTAKDEEVVSFVKSLIDDEDTIKVAFGTEGGLFRQRIGVPTVICGPGSMDQGHRPDEYITETQLSNCDAMLDSLITRLS